MKKIDKIVAGNLSSREEEKIIEEMIEAKFDKANRKEWVKRLKQDFHVERTVGNAKISTFSMTRILSIAASIALFIIALVFFTQTNKSTQELAASYIQTSKLYHPGSLKGIADSEKNRNQAIKYFNLKDYSRAIPFFEKIEQPTEEDIYFIGLAHLLREDFSSAIAKFKTLSENTSSFKEEANWYLSLSLLLNKQEKEAIDVLLKIHPSHWNFENAQILLASLT